MSKIKAIICSALLWMVICSLYISTVLIECNGFPLHHIVTSSITGLWMADKVVDFYHWLREN